MNAAQAFVRNVRTCRPDVKGAERVNDFETEMRLS